MPCDLLGRGVAADVEEVRRLAAIELEHVNGRHRKPCAVDHTCHVTAEVDVVEPRCRRYALLRILLALVAQHRDVRVAEERTVVEVELCVEHDDFVVLGEDERIDLELRAVFVNECSVELLHG